MKKHLLTAALGLLAVLCGAAQTPPESIIVEVKTSTGSISGNTWTSSTQNVQVSTTGSMIQNADTNAGENLGFGTTRGERTIKISADVPGYYVSQISARARGVSGDKVRISVDGSKRLATSANAQLFNLLVADNYITPELTIRGDENNYLSNNKKAIFEDFTIVLSPIVTSETSCFLSWSSELTPATELVDGGKYLLYDASKIYGSDEQTGRGGFNYVNVDNNEIYLQRERTTTNASGKVDASKYVFIAHKSGDNWMFEHLGTHKFLPGVGSRMEPVVLSDYAGEFTLTSGEDSAAFLVKSTSSTEYLDGNGNTTVTWSTTDTSDLHWFRFFSVNESNIVEEDSYKQYHVVVNSSYEDNTCSIKFWLKKNVDLAYVTAFTTCTNPDYIVREGNTEFNITWNYPLELNHVYRVNLKPTASNRYTLKFDGTNALNSYTVDDTSFLGEKYLWYFKHNGFNKTGVPLVSLYTLVGNEEKGAIFGTGGNSIATFGTNPTGLMPMPSTYGSKQEGDFCLKHPDANDWINEFGNKGKLSTWSDSEAQGNDGSVIRISSLTDDDYAALSDTEENKNAAKANPTPENIKSLFSTNATVTFNFPALNGNAVSATASVTKGSTYAQALTSFEIPEFTVSDADKDKIIVGSASLPITGTWGFPEIEFGRVYRMALRNKSQHNCNYFYANPATKVISTRDAVAADVLSPDRLFYFTEAEGSTPEVRLVHLHSVALGDNYGFTTAKPTDSKGELSENQMTFKVVSNSQGNDYYGFSLQHPDESEKLGHVNDIGGTLGCYTENGTSQNDRGSCFRLYSLSDSEIDAIEGASDEEKAAAKANQNVENVLALCKYTMEPERAAIWNSTADARAQLSGENVIKLPGRLAIEFFTEQETNYANATDPIEKAMILGNLKAYNLMGKSFETTDGAVLTLRSSDFGGNQNRGYLTNNGSGYLMTTAAMGVTNNAAEVTNDNFKFTFVTVDGKKYLYNLGADKFLNAFGKKTDQTWPSTNAAGDYTWRFAFIPTEIEELLPFNGDNAFTLRAGLTPTNHSYWAEDNDTHVGGMSLIDAGVRPVIVSMGLTSRADGNGLVAEYANAKLSDQEVEALRGRISDAIAEVTAELPEITEDKHIVNHYIPGTVSNINTAETPDHKHYFMENGEIQNFVENTAYVLLQDAEEGETEPKAWAVCKTYGDIKLIPYVEPNDTASYAWKPTLVVPETVETEGEGEEIAARSLAPASYKFSHVVDNNPKLLTIDNVTDHEIGTDTLGKVTIAGKNYTVTSTSAQANTTTTEITEITANGDEATEVYDMLGRRLAKPVRGINIINGRKVLRK
ncbi:MAG: hypothetical protein NC301_01505 [Bacteroides sp.]|nr:hypothetical protein [Bacteroides sp.]MCM1378559.1 hypothetical protein [Bacteroides sp.]MCM1444860.1 hypothetical protein [Prevotella sp.]